MLSVNILLCYIVFQVVLEATFNSQQGDIALDDLDIEPLGCRAPTNAPMTTMPATSKTTYIDKNTT